MVTNLHSSTLQRSFDSITFVDMVPDSFCVLRAESQWTSETAGGQADLGKNPQLLMKVTKKTDITISMNQVWEYVVKGLFSVYVLSLSLPHVFTRSLSRLLSLSVPPSLSLSLSLPPTYTRSLAY